MRGWAGPRTRVWGRGGATRARFKTKNEQNKSGFGGRAETPSSLARLPGARPRGGIDRDTEV